MKERKQLQKRHYIKYCKLLFQFSKHTLLLFCTNLQSLPRFVIFLPRFHITKATVFVIPLTSSFGIVLVLKFGHE